jgi:hypothetical protein
MHRMGMQYAGGYYLVAHRRHQLLQADHAARAKEFAAGRSGLRGYAIRLLPNHPDAVTPFMPGLILWAAETFAGTPELALH